MRELAEDVRNRRVADDLRQMADQIDEYSRLVTQRSGQPGEGAQLEQAYDDLNSSLTSLSQHFV